MNSPFDLNATLFNIPGSKGSLAYSVLDSFESILITGSSGGGKSSGVAKKISESFIRQGYGGIVLSVKSERESWIEYCKKHDALDRLVIIGPNGKHSFDLLNYELSKTGSDLPFTENIYQLLVTILNAEKNKEDASSENSFWDNALEILVINAIQLCFLAYGSLSFEKLYHIVLAAPKLELAINNDSSNAFTVAFELAEKNLQQKIVELNKTLLAENETLPSDKEKYEAAITQAIPEIALLKSIDQFFIESYKSLSPKTRSIVDFIFLNFLGRFLREPIKSLFCDCQTTFTPEDCFSGKILLFDIPTKLFHKAGRSAQSLFKLVFQRAVEKRIINDDTRPVFIWSDEGQEFLHSKDNDFLATARSCKSSSVLVTQNLPGLYAAMGGSKSEYRVKALLALYGTKFFCSNSDPETNKFASELFGDGFRIDESSTFTLSGDFSTSHTDSYKLERMVRPEQFSGFLKTGGKRNNFLVDAYVHLQNRLFPDNLPFQKVTFSQL